MNALILGVTKVVPPSQFLSWKSMSSHLIDLRTTTLFRDAEKIFETGVPPGHRITRGPRTYPLGGILPPKQNLSQTFPNLYILM